MAQEGFGLLGEVLGGGIDRQGAFLEGQLLGNKSAEAMAKARIRRDEAEQRLKLKAALQQIGIAQEQAGGLETILRGGFGNISQGTDALGDIFDQGQRAAIGDPAQTPEIGDINRRLASLASGPVDPVQSAGAGLFADIFGPQAGEVQVAPTGEALIDQREQAARLSEARRLNPEQFRSSTTFNLGGTPGIDDPLGDLIEGESIIPEDFDPTAALGLGGAVRQAANVIGGLVDLPDNVKGVQLQAPETRKANAILNQLATISTLEGVVAIPGRPTNEVREMFSGLEAHPLDVLAGDAVAFENWKRQLELYKREATNITKRLRAGTVKPGTARFDENVQAAQILNGLQADFQAVLDAFEATKVRKTAPRSAFEVGETRESGGAKITREQ
jgi:hypothetical protein